MDECVCRPPPRPKSLSRKLHFHASLALRLLQSMAKLRNVPRAAKSLEELQMVVGIPASESVGFEFGVKVLGQEMATSVAV